MIKSFEIRNFRCFENLKSTPLRRFNIIVGESGSGKTSLLEAIFLLGGANPEIYFRLRNWRGFSSSIALHGTKESYESIFRDMFYNFEQSRGATISSIDSETGKRSLEIYYKSQDSFSLPLKGTDQNAFQIDPIVFKWNVDNRIYDSTLELKEGAFKISGSAPVAPIVYFNPFNAHSQQNAAAFSTLSRRFQTAKLLNAVQHVFSNVRDITLEIIAGETLLHVATGLSERLPLGDVSGGISKFISIALGVLANPGGVIIVDEIEDGFYYKHLANVWSSLTRLCRDNEVQLIATTHSYEFLKAIAPAFEDDGILAKEFQLMRLEKGKDSQPLITRVDGQTYRNAILNDFEIR